MSQKEDYTVLGVMSGTSLDGLDLALCRFTLEGKHWRYTGIQCDTIPYTTIWKEKLSSVAAGSAFDLTSLDIEFGNFIAGSVNRFLSEQPAKVDYIASHGHTIFHRPELGITLQIGNGAVIAAKTGITTVCDFRTMDVANGGQGAPLVPIGDELLFGCYDACLNLGGISNISYKQDGKRVAFDISPCNMAFNYLAQMLGFGYDENGENACLGEIDRLLLDRLNDLEYYRYSGAKSLGREWFDHFFLPILQKSDTSIRNQLRTVMEHIIFQIKKILDTIPGENILMTGGGARNTFLIQLLRKSCNKQLILPEPEIIDFKEAVIFAFLGVLRMKNEINCLQDVTGGRSDLVSGAVYPANNIKL